MRRSSAGSTSRRSERRLTPGRERRAGRSAASYHAAVTTPARCEFCSEEIPAGTPKCPHCGEALGRARSAPTGWGSPAKPMVVAVFGVLHLGFGALGVCGQVWTLVVMSQLSGNPMFSQAFEQSWGAPGSALRTFMTFNLVVYLVTALLQLAAGYGLLAMRPWGRKVAVGLALFGLGYGVLSGAISLPLMLENLPAAQRPIAIGSALVGHLINLGYQGLVVFFLTRPHVRAAFDRRAAA